MVREKTESQVPYYLNYPKSYKWRPILSTTAAVLVFGVGMTLTSAPLVFANPGSSVDVPDLPNPGQQPDLPDPGRPEQPQPSPGQPPETTQPPIDPQPDRPEPPREQPHQPEQPQEPQRPEQPGSPPPERPDTPEPKTSPEPEKPSKSEPKQEKPGPKSEPDRPQSDQPKSHSVPPTGEPGIPKAPNQFLQGEQNNTASPKEDSEEKLDKEQNEPVKTKPDKLPDTSTPYPTMLLGSMFGAMTGAFLLFSRKRTNGS